MINAVHYSPLQDNVEFNKKNQGIPYGASEKKAKTTHYPGRDSLQNVTLNDKYIYITTHDEQHKRIAKGQILDTESHTALSGYFTNEATVAARINNVNGTFDAYGIARDTCIEPFSKNRKSCRCLR